jgi:hypothetical protein
MKGDKVNDRGGRKYEEKYEGRKLIGNGKGGKILL